MKPYLKLVINELRKKKLFALLFFIAHYGVLQFLFFMCFPQPTNSSHSIVHNENLFILIIVTMLYILPLILYCTFTSDKRNFTRYMIFSLPVKRSALIFSRFLGFLSLVLFFLFGHVLLLLLLFTNLGHFFFLNDFIIGLFIKFKIVSLTTFFASVIMLAGIISATESIVCVMKKYKTVFVFVYMMFSVVGTLWFSNYGALLIGRDTLQFTYNHFLDKAYHILPIMNIYFFVVGLVFLLVGMVLYDRYAEV